MSDSGLDTARRTFAKLGITVLILGLLSLLFLGDASKELMAGTIAGITLCAVTGIWLATRPSVAIGVAAGASLAILGVLDLLLTMKQGGLELIAPLIDFAFAVRVFVGCASYANALATASRDEQSFPTDAGSGTAGR